MKTKVFLIVVGILIAAITATSIGWGTTHKQSKERKETIEFQRHTIDSLLALPPVESNEIRIELKMDVTDKSHLTVNGKGNSGTISVPQERRYVVEIDSASFNVIRDK